MAKKLTQKQALFAKEYLKDLNATQAAIRAKYSKRTAQRIGSENLSKPLIAAEIQKNMHRRAKKLEITTDYVLGNIRVITERCMEMQIVFDKDGNPEVVALEDGTEALVVAKFDPSNALKGNELMGRHLKMFTDKLLVDFNPDDEPITRIIRTEVSAGVRKKIHG